MAEVSDEEDPEDPEGEDEEPPPCMPTPSEPLEESVYGYVIASLINDSADLSLHGKRKMVRIATAFGLFFIMFATQCFLLESTKKLVSPIQVANARKVYGQFEKIMYTDLAGVSHTFNTSHGYPRGIGIQFFNASNFDKLRAEEQQEVCNIPLSQPWFLLVILVIWALAVLNNVRNAANFVVRFLTLPTIRENQDGLVATDDGVEIVGMPLWLKTSLTVVILIPRMIMCCFLLWLGARWLTATLGYSDVLLNSLALLLILDLAEVVYAAIVPFHGKRLVQRTLVPHVHKEEPGTMCAMFGMMLLGIFALAFSAVYMFKLQQVLPEYKWDVHEVCAALLTKEAAV